MHADQHHPDTPPATEELTGNLKQAVDAVKGQQPPAEAVAGSVERASRLAAQAARRRRRMQVAFALSSIAATFFIALLVWMHNTRDEASRVYHESAEFIPESQLNLLGARQARPEGDPADTERPDFPPAPLYRNVDRLAEGGAPTVTRPGESIGIPGATDGTSNSVSLPPGSGGGSGTGSGEGRLIVGALMERKRGEKELDEREIRRQLNEEFFKKSGGKDAKPGEPQNDSLGGNGSGPGEVDKKKLKKLSEDWGKLPEKAREKAAEELMRDMPPRYREAVADYFRKLGKPVPGEKQSPQVWKQAARPTFARVYVGDGNALELVSLHVTVTVEGSRARTLVDHVFRNPHDRQLEGTFEYPLPTGASPSYFAMFLGQTRDTVPPLFTRRGNAPPLTQEALASLAPDQLVRHVDNQDWGRLQEGRIVAKDKALESYEEVTRRRIDPALLEYAGGNTFRGRVFPIPPKGYNRVLIAYEEELPFVGEQMRYRFPLPDCKLSEMQLTLSANAAECKDAAFQPKEAKREEGGSRLAFTHTWHGEIKGGDAEFRFTPPNPQVQAISGRQGESGPLYLYARIRPELKVEKAQPFARHAIFLLDTSLSEHPDRFDVNMKLMRAILEADSDIEQFNVLTFNVGTAWVEPKGWLPNTQAGRETVFKRLNGLVLEGATDFGAALNQLAKGPVQPPFVKGGAAADIFVLSDGQITWGEVEASALVSAFEQRCPYRTRFHCYRTGLGAENLDLFGALTRKGGGVYNCFTKDAIAAAAKAHRSQCLQVDSVKLVGGPGAADVLVAGRRAAVYPGGDLVVAARMKDTGKAQVVVEGTFNGQRFAQEYSLEARGDGELAPRGWGEVAVASLLALNDPKLEGLATAYCQQFGICSRVASFLVLENENDYKRLNLEQERGRTLSGDLAKFLDESWATLGKPATAREQFTRFLKQVDGRTKLLEGQNGKHVAKLLALLKDADFDIPAGTIAGALLHKGDVPPQYLATRDADPRDVSAYLTEAKRRANAGDADGAVRALSSVIEEHPGRGDALRLVGYRLLDLQQPAQAARLFAQVQRQRPFEPHSYRDLARSLEDAGRYGLAAVQYEVVLAGTWHSRFRDSLKQVAREEYAAMMREAIRRRAVGKELADLFGERLEGLAADTKTSDLRVTISWNTDDTDIDLWVIEPDGSKCFYQNRQTKTGGELSEDMTQGYGPERYRVARAAKGTYRVMVHYYRANPNLLAGETHVNVVVTRYAGTPRETTERHTVILKKPGEAVEVCRVEN
jgi:tetratricopeptide (TPR) repeat protein